MAKEPHGDNPVDDFIQKESPSLLEEYLINKGNTYTTSDGEKHESIEEARDHQGDLNCADMDED